MNVYQQKLFEELSALVETNDAFYSKDFEVDDNVYRIFNYRLASYTDFLQPSALECRGTMYEVNNDGQPVRLASLPIEKFFNLNENPMTMDLDLSRVCRIELKADGSLISTYSHKGQLRLKSKGSISSDQCLAAMSFLDDDDKNHQFGNELYVLAKNNCTVNLEWCAPDNRIVIGYPKPCLRVLNVRDNTTGTYVDKNKLTDYEEIYTRWIDSVEVDNPATFVNQIPEMTDVEGYVVYLPENFKVKVKTDWYLTQHRAKDSINSPRRLYEAVLAESTDDLRSLFYDDPLVIQKIEEMERFVDQKYNALVNGVERFYEQNKHMERKDYAILGQQELDRLQFSLAMMKYTGKNVDYKEFMIKKWKDFGVRDITPDEE